MKVWIVEVDAVYQTDHEIKEPFYKTVKAAMTAYSGKWIKTGKIYRLPRSGKDDLILRRVEVED